ncbi:MAG: flavin reductase family protein [Planctomycetota bacterium]
MVSDDAYERESVARTGERVDSAAPDVVAALDVLATESVGVMTSSFEGDRAGIRVLSLQQCATEPMLVCVSVRKGHFIEPLIRDSHHFGLCIMEPSDKLAVRKFPEDPAPGADDPFDAFPTMSLKSGVPIIERGIAALDCEVVRHFDLEADHEIYVGLVLAAKMFRS